MSVPRMIAGVCIVLGPWVSFFVLVLAFGIGLYGITKLMQRKGV